MIVEFGHFALILALLVAVVQTVVPFLGARARDARMMNVADARGAVRNLALLTLAFLALMHAYVTSDFSVANVAANSHSTKPMLYKISGVWGNHEGSMLLWVLILALFGAAVAAVRQQSAGNAQSQCAVGAGIDCAGVFAVHRADVRSVRAA